MSDNITTKVVEVVVRHRSSVPGARWCEPKGWAPTNLIEGAEYVADTGSWWDPSEEAAGILVWTAPDAVKGDVATVSLDDLRVASCGDCRVIGRVEVA